jgi:DNA-binding winged helix-turn-helix (wHTH) protein
MSEQPEPQQFLIPQLLWNKYQPGKLCYQLGTVRLTHDGILSNEEARIKLPQGQMLVMLRNLLLYYPQIVTYETVIDRLWPNPDSMPLWHMNILKKNASELYQRLPAVGLKLVNKPKFGYSVAFLRKP